MKSGPNLHIAIEGMDGVGKTTTAKRLSEILDFTLVDKKLQLLLDDAGSIDSYPKIRNYLNEQDNPALNSWFYGLGNFYLYHKFKGDNIITERHMFSNYNWGNQQESELIFGTILKILGQPDYTFVLEADEEILRERLIGRNKNDPDLQKDPLIPRSHKEMKDFLLKFNLRYEIIDTSSLTCEQVCEKITKILKLDNII